LNKNRCTSLCSNLCPQPAWATVFFSCPCAIHSGCGSKPCFERFTALRQTSPVRRHFAARRHPLSRPNLFRPRLLLAKGQRSGIHSLAAGSYRNGLRTRPRFRRCIVSGTTRKHANEAATALQQSSLDSHPLLLAGHSQTGLLKHQGDLFPGTGSTTSGRHSPSQLSDDLRPADHVPRGRYPSGLAPYVPGSRLGIVSAKVSWRFLGTEHRSIPLSAGAGFSQFGVVFGWTHWQALVVGPFVVELFVVGFFARSPSVVCHPVPPVTRSRTPHASQVERTPWARTPWRGFAPPLSHRGLPRHQAKKVCRCRPGSRGFPPRPPGHFPSDRMSGLTDGRCFCDTKAACICVRITPTSLRRARTSPSPGIRLYGSAPNREMVSLYPLACW
jgi:hypothetical protein